MPRSSPAEAKLGYELIGQQPAIAARGDAVDLVVRAHGAQRAGADRLGKDRKKRLLPVTVM